jgi:hypothetical protein
MKVRDLIKYLKGFHGGDEVVGGLPAIVKPSCVVCGKTASVPCWEDRRPVCDAHYNAFATETELCFFNRY